MIIGLERKKLTLPLGRSAMVGLAPRSTDARLFTSSVGSIEGEIVTWPAACMAHKAAARIWIDVFILIDLLW